MCGIVGFSGNDAKLIRRMSDMIMHRGPDQDGFFFDRFISLGHRRLSIIDISEKGRQPIFNEKGDILVIFNGEIYNYQELKRELEKCGHRFSTNTDTEVLVHGYEQWGYDLPQRLNGIFAFCIYDLKNRKLFFARDHLGVKPFYYYVGKELVFASEIKAILLHPCVLREVDIESLNKYLSFRYVPGENTMFKDVKRLLPGHFMVYDLKKRIKVIKRYWGLSVVNNSGKSCEACVAELSHQLKKSVLMQLMSDVPLGVFLSGGVDSGAIVALMKSLGVRDIKTFSIGFSEYNDKEREMDHAQMVSDYLGTDHHKFIIDPDSLQELPNVVWHQDEPVGVDTSIPTFLLSKYTGKHVTVVLSGEGGDEAFGGYVQYGALNLAEKVLNPVPKYLRNNVLSQIVSVTPVSILTKFFKYPGSIGVEGRSRLSDFVKTIDDRAESYVKLVSVFSENEKKLLFGGELADVQKKCDIIKDVRLNYFSNGLPLGDQIFLRENATFLPDFVLSRLDKMSMAWSIESRVPLLDKDLVSLVSGIPRDFKKDKLVFRQAVKNLLPEVIVKRKKVPFYMPLDSWYGHGLKDICAKVLDSNNLVVKKYFSQEFINNLLSKSSSSMLHSRQLWVLLNFALWHKIYIENNFLKPKKFDDLY